MLVKLILISTMFAFVCAQAIEPPLIRHLLPLGESHPDSILDSESTITEVRRALQTSTPSASVNPPRASIANHESTHPDSKHPKRRATDSKGTRGTDTRPGCCG